MRIVFDTNVLVAALRSRQGASRVWLEAALQRKFVLLLSVPLVLEYEAVLTREEHLAEIGGSAHDIGLIVDALCAVGEVVELGLPWHLALPDPADMMVLETALSGRADALLTFNTRDFQGAEAYGFSLKQPGDALREWFGGQI